MADVDELPDSKRQRPKLADRLSTLYVPFACVGASLLLIGLFYAKTRYSHYVLVGEELAFLGATLQHGADDWLLRGYSYYFSTYPELESTVTNYIRPIGNILVWICHAIFGDRYQFYFIIYYASALSAFLLLLLSVRPLRPQAGLLLASALAWSVFCPGAVGKGLWFMPAMFDMVVGFFVVAAFYCTLREKDILAIFLLLLALFTKETASFAPVAAALTVLLVRPRSTRNWATAAALLSPLAIWIAFRLIAFGGVLDGTQTSFGPRGLLLHGLLRWPLGVAWQSWMGMVAGWTSSGDRKSVV